MHAPLLGAFLVLAGTHHTLAANPPAGRIPAANPEAGEAAASGRSSLRRDMLTECLQNGAAAALFGGPVGISPYLMGALGCGVGAVSAVLAAGVVQAWEEPAIVPQMVVTAWNAIPGLDSGSVTLDVLTAPLVMLASVSDVAGVLLAPVLGSAKEPAVMIAQGAPTDIAAPSPETLVAGRYPPGVGAEWGPLEP